MIMMGECSFCSRSTRLGFGFFQVDERKQTRLRKVLAVVGGIEAVAIS